MPNNIITSIFLPSHAPELEPAGKHLAFRCGNRLSNLVFDTYDDIIEAACDAWSKLIAQPEAITPSARDIGPTSVRSYDSWFFTWGRCVEWFLFHVLHAGRALARFKVQRASRVLRGELGRLVNALVGKTPSRKSWPT
jgi:hypothetical protein